MNRKQVFAGCVLLAAMALSTPRAWSHDSGQHAGQPAAQSSGNTPASP